MNINDFIQELKEIKENPEVLAEIDSEMEQVLKEIIKIERRYIYGLDSTSASNRRTAIQELLHDKIKNRGR